MFSRKISLFGKMKRGRSPSFELFKLDMYVCGNFFYYFYFFMLPT